MSVKQELIYDTSHTNFFIGIVNISNRALYSLLGLAAIFSAAKLPVLLMGGVLEVGKLVTATWLYHNWKKTLNY